MLECSVITWDESNEFSFLEFGALLRFVPCPAWVEKTHWAEFC